jgi:hypothetical protein
MKSGCWKRRREKGAEVLKIENTNKEVGLEEYKLSMKLNGGFIIVALITMIVGIIGWRGDRPPAQP